MPRSACGPGVLGDEQSAEEESFAAGLLDYPHYTRPEIADGRPVPRVLLEGNHEAIRRWRRKQALGRTSLRRPDLLGEPGTQRRGSAAARRVSRRADRAVLTSENILTMGSLPWQTSLKSSKPKP